MGTLLLTSVFSLLFFMFSPTHAKSTTFYDLPIELQFVALCESGGKQSARGPFGEIGIMQIHPKYHLIRAKSLGFNIYNANDNMAYALILYTEHGLTPLNASKKCHGPMTYRATLWSNGVN